MTRASLIINNEAYTKHIYLYLGQLISNSGGIGLIYDIQVS